MRQQLKAAAIAAALTGCATGPRETEQGLVELLKFWQGRDISSLISTWGPPARVDELPNGNRLYTYSKSSTYRQPTFVSPGYSTPSRTTVNVVGNTAYATTTPGTTVGTTVMGGNTYESYCNVFLTVDMATQRVSSSRYEGNSCRSVPPNQQR